MISHTLAVIFALSVLISSTLAGSLFQSNPLNSLNNLIPSGVITPLGFAQAAVANPQDAINKVIDIPRASVQLATDTTMQGIHFAQDLTTEGGVRGIIKGTVLRTIQDIKRNIADALRSLAKYMIQLIPTNVREVALNVIDQFLFMMRQYLPSVEPFVNQIVKSAPSGNGF